MVRKLETTIKDLLDIQGTYKTINGGGGDDKKYMTRETASRIQSATCRNNGGYTSKNSFASRAMSAAYKNEPYAYQSNRKQAASICPCPTCVLL